LTLQKGMHPPSINRNLAAQEWKHRRKKKNIKKVDIVEEIVKLFCKTCGKETDQKYIGLEGTKRGKVMRCPICKHTVVQAYDGTVTDMDKK
jgi:DNA-directed RNA polymerase subunit RPC12/RpoP